MTNPVSAQPAGSPLRKLSTLLLVEGIVLAVLGVLAIAVPVIATLAVTIFLGWLFLVSGVLGLVASFMARGAPGFWWGVASDVVAIVAGVILIAAPVPGALSLTFVVIALFLLQGIATVMYAIEYRRELAGRWGLMLASGIVTLLLAAIIIGGLPGSAAWTLGLLVGIDMLFGGFALIAMGLAGRKAT